MVVIETEEEKQEEQVKNPPLSKPKSSSSSKTASYSAPAATSTADTSTQSPTAKNDDSDGFETASEREVDSDHDENDALGPETTSQTQSQQFDEAESEQKALDESNEAKLEGNKLFGNGQYEEALIKYETALNISPETDSSVDLRSNCHANRAICFLKLGKYEETIKECTKAIELNPSYVKALVRRGEAHEKLENFEDAIADMKKILELDPSNEQARRAIRRMEPLAVEKREKMKEEMIGKLKDMGNSLLGRFGMSLDNFKAVKDPNTGSYSVSFQR